MSRSGDCGKRPRWPCEPLAGGSGPGHDRGDGPTSGHRIQACCDRRQHASAGLHMPATRQIPVGGQYPPARPPPPPPRTSTLTARLGGRWTVDCETASRGDHLVEVGMPKLKELTDTWSGAHQPDIIAQWGKMRLVRYLARGPRRHPVPVPSCRHSWPSPTSWTSPLGSAWLITWSSGAWSCSSWISGSQIAGTGISGSRTTFVWST
jgi:hypothetical protein